MQDGRTDSELIERKLLDAEQILSIVAEEIDDIVNSNDHQARRFIIERLVSDVSVRTLESKKRIRRPYTLKLRLAGPRPSPPDRPLAGPNLTSTSSKYNFTGGSTGTSGPAEPLILTVDLGVIDTRSDPQPRGQGNPGRRIAIASCRTVGHTTQWNQQ